MNKQIAQELTKLYIEHQDTIPTKKFIIEVYFHFLNNLKSKEENEELNDEVEIIEEKKIPEKLDIDEEEKGKYIIWNTEFEQCTTLEMKIIKRQDYIIRKINEIIDYLKSKGE